LHDRKIRLRRRADRRDALRSAARAGDVDFSGTWSVSGHIVNNSVIVYASPVCKFQQTGDQLTGVCKGPNDVGAATGAVNGADIHWIWRIAPTNALGLAGVATFHGTLGRDNVVRGFFNHSIRPGASGPFTAQKV
jgi:hypothetical protein